jgi:hypothetical protein
MSSSGPVLQVISSALKAWLRMQCQGIDRLEIKLNGSALALLQGRLAGAQLLAQGVTYEHLPLEEVNLSSDAIHVDIGALWRGQPLQLQQPFCIRGAVVLTPQGLTTALKQPPWLPLAAQLAADFLEGKPLSHVDIQAGRLQLSTATEGHQPCIRREVQIIAAAEQVQMVASDPHTCSILPVDPAIRIERAVIEADRLLLEGEALVTAA